MPAPNVLMFITDGHRADALGCAGSPIARTPAIDAFASQGVLCERTFCTHSVCMPTRGSIFTGRYPHIHGTWANGVALRRSETTLPEVLAGHGYATCASGKVHFEPQQPYVQQFGGLSPRIDTSREPYYGFQEVHLSENHIGQEYIDFIRENHPELEQRALTRDRMPEELHDLQWITDRAIDFIQRQVAAGRPFLCSCSYHELSPPCTPPENYIGLFDPNDMPVPELRPEDLDLKPPFYRQCYEGYLARNRHPDASTLQRYLASYYDQLAFIDRQFARLMDVLTAAGAMDNTIVLFTADHGLSLNDHFQWRHGPFLFDQVINVPMIWRVPGGLAGARSQGLIEGVDIMPTILDLCGVPEPAGVQGRSLAPMLTGTVADSGRDSVLVQERHAPDLLARGLDPELIWQVGVRTHDWKLVHYVDYPHGELYDLREDPGEFHNLWADPGYLPRRREMEALLMDRLASSQDPLPVREPDVHY